MRSTKRSVAIAVALLVSAAACSSSQRSGDAVEATGRKLASETLHAPVGYAPDQTAGADGTMSDAVFAREAEGGNSRSSAGFQGGFKQIYNSQSDNETLEITLLQFSSPARALAYLNGTLGGTLSIYSPTHHPYPAVPGAIEIVGTKAYQKIWARAVVATKGRDYMFLVYLLDSGAPPPLEYGLWVKDQYAALG